MSKIIHFEIQADEPERAVKFYETVFGWKTSQYDGGYPYWLVTAGADDEPGINGAIGKRADPAVGVYDIVSVESVDAALEKIQAAGGQVVRPKMAVPGVGYAAYFRDTEGNVLGLMQNDPDAK